MKLKFLHIVNIGLIKDEKIQLDKSLICFFGDIRQGKSTILNSVRWCFGGSFPATILRNGSREGYIELAFEGGHIRREFYVAKDQTTKARAIQYVIDGHDVPRPTDAIRDMLNPFLLDQNYLVNMSELDRKRYFAELFAVDTTDLDKQHDDIDREARELRSKIKGYGDIDVTPVEMVDVAALKAERQKIVDAGNAAAKEVEEKIRQINEAYDAAVAETTKRNYAAKEDAEQRRYAQQRIDDIGNEIAILEQQIISLRQERGEISGNLESRDPIQPVPLPARPDHSELRATLKALDTSELDEKISQAAAQNVRHEQYLKNQARYEERAADELTLNGFEKRLRDIRDEKLTRLKTISETCPVPGLTFDENGNFSYEDTAAGMLSTSQLMKLSSDLSALYPEGFGIELLDRGESLGKSIFTFVDRAKAESKTILAAIVGERPAAVSDEIGVFVVEQGKIK